MIVTSDHRMNTREIGPDDVFIFDLVERLQISSCQEITQYSTDNTAEIRLISQDDDDLLSIGNATSTAQMENILVRSKEQSSSNKVLPSCFQSSTMPSHPVGLVKTITVNQSTKLDCLPFHCRAKHQTIVPLS